MRFEKTQMLSFLLLTNSLLAACLFRSYANKDFEKLKDAIMTASDKEEPTFRSVEIQISSAKYIDSENSSALHQLLNKIGTLKSYYVASGGFGKVVSIIQGEARFAVKEISFIDFLIDLKIQYLKASPTHYACHASVLGRITSALPLQNFSDKTSSFQQAHNELSVFVDKEVDTMCAGREDAKKSLKDQLFKYFRGLSTEAFFAENLSHYSNKYEHPDFPSFPIFYECIFDWNLNTYLVMQFKTRSLHDLLQDDTLALELSENLLVDLSLLYQADVIFDYGFSHCDLKPQNVVIKKEPLWQHLSIMDYGLISANNAPCRGGTYYYQPIEMHFELPYDPKDFEKIFACPACQNDAFAIGQIMLAIELSKTKFENHLKSYDKLISQGVKTEAAFDSFFKKAEAALKEKYDSYASIFSARQQEHEVLALFHKLILKLLAFNPTKRFTVRAALLITHQLYLAVTAKEKQNTHKKLADLMIKDINKVFEIYDFKAVSKLAVGEARAIIADTINDVKPELEQLYYTWLLFF